MIKLVTRALRPSQQHRRTEETGVAHPDPSLKTDPNADVDDRDKNDDNQVQKLSLRNFERLLFTIAIYPKSLNRGKSLVCEKSQISARAYSLNLRRLLSERRRRLKFRLARCKRADNIHARERLRGYATRGELPLSGVFSESRVFTESRACSGILLILLISLPPKLDATSSQENPMRLWIQLRQPCIIGVIEFDCWSMWRNARDMRGLLCGLYS